MACDDQVLAEIANPRSYATCLIALLEKSVARRGWAMAQAVVHQAHEASLRLAQILDVTRPQTKHVWKPALAFVGAFSVLCLVVVSRAPRFVAFEPNARALQSGEAHPALLTQSQMSAATAIPAAMRTVPPSSLKTIHHQSAAHATRQLPVHRTPAPLVIAARWSPERSPVNAETIGTDNSVVPVSETLLIIRTSQRIGPHSWVWSVDVWRLNLVNSAQDGAEKVPLAKKT
jgi:hypothetical protein